MSGSLQVLILEDRPADAELVLHQLRRAGFECAAQIVATESEYLAALETAPDLILADYQLPQFDGMRALELLKARGLDIPFIIVSGTIGEEIAVDAMKRGASDYLLKDRLARLGPAVAHALEQKRLREVNRRAEEALRASEERYRTLAEAAHDMISLVDANGKLTYTNQFAASQFGVAPHELVGKHITEIFPPDIAARQEANLQQVLKSGAALYVEAPASFRGKAVWLGSWLTPIKGEHGRAEAVLVVSRDITERKQSEEMLRRRLAEQDALSKISAALRTAETLDEMLPLLLDETLSALDCQNGSIRLYRPEDNELYSAATRGWFEQFQSISLKPGEGIMGTVFSTGQAHVSREFYSDPLVQPSARTRVPPGWGGICVPLRAANKVVGAMFVSVPLPREITPAEAKLLNSLAEIAGTALHRLRLHEETKRRLEQLQALRAVDRAIAASLDWNITLTILLHQVTAQLRVDAAGILLFDPHSLTLKYAAGRGFRGLEYEKSRLRVGEGLAGRAALERRMVRVPGALQASDMVRVNLMRSEGFVAYIALPFIAKGELKGVLEIFHRAPLAFDPEWLEFLETLAGQAAIAMDNLELFDGLQRSRNELMLAYDTTIEGWSRALDLRDRETEGHTQRVAELTLRLARAAGMTEEELVHVRRGALLHDIGKMGVPDAILFKPEPLTPTEWAMMRKHPTYAFELLSPIGYLRPALDIPYCHHEKWDGTGYPRGLADEQIPLAARLFAVVDVWDALRSDRPYRSGWSEEKVLEHIQSLSGTHFDPMAVRIFFQALREKK